MNRTERFVSMPQHRMTICLRGRRCCATGVVAALLALCCSLLSAADQQAAAGPPYQACGFKVGELTADSAIIWARLTLRAERNPGDATGETLQQVPGGKKKKAAKQAAEESETTPPVELPGAVPGAPGEVRVAYRVASAADWQFTAWEPVDPQRDFTRQFTVAKLQPGTRYDIRVESRAAHGGPAGATQAGHFGTAPLADQAARVVFVVTTCHAMRSRDCPEGFKIYEHILRLNPQFFVHTGDIVYYDGEPDTWARSVDLARYHWWRAYSLPRTVAFQREVPTYFEKDDHDTWQDDCWSTLKNKKMGDFTFADGQTIFREQVPMGESTYRTYRWGKDLQIWLTEGRDFRSPNNAPDGPQKSIWGETQKAWFKQTVTASDATFRVLISPTALVGPDRDNKNDNHANKGFTHEGDELRQFIGSQKNMAVLHGDRHWQYFSIDPKTGVRNYSCGPCSDLHAQGWKQEDYVPEYHRYLRVKGGFLAGIVERFDGKPRLTLRFYDVDGNVRFEDVIDAVR
jgi:alkaline phosphatase D